MKQATILLLCACALVPALAAGIPALAETSQAGTETTSTTTGGIGPAVFPQAEAASAREQRAYRRWRRKLDRHGVWRGQDLVAAPRIDERPPTSDGAPACPRRAGGSEAAAGSAARRGAASYSASR